MDQELLKLEQMNAQELELIRQVHEQKIAYLNTKIYMKMKELEQKAQEVLKRKRSQISVPEDPILEDGLIEREQENTEELIQQTQQQMKNELQNIKNKYEGELQELQKQLKKRDLMIEQLTLEIKMYQRCKYENLDNMKIEYLSNLIDMTQEIKSMI